MPEQCSHIGSNSQALAKPRISRSQREDWDMAVRTPRGFTVDMPIDYAFALLARLWLTDTKRADPRRVLTNYEATRGLPAMLGYCLGIPTALYGFYPHVFVIVGISFGEILLYPSNRWVLPRLIAGGRAWNTISGYGALQMAGTALVYWRHGWPGVVSWVMGWTFMGVLSWYMHRRQRRRYRTHYGFPLDDTFLLAYRLHARRLGITDDPSMTADEIETGQWRRCLERYAELAPAAVCASTEMRAALEDTVVGGAAPAAPTA